MIRKFVSQIVKKTIQRLLDKLGYRIVSGYESSAVTDALAVAVHRIVSFKPDQSYLRSLPKTEYVTIQ